MSIQTNAMDRFQVCFLAIGCVFHAFIGCLIPAIFIGSVCLRRDYLKEMFKRLKEALEEGREVSFITNMDDVISPFIGQCADVFLNKNWWKQTIQTFICPHANHIQCLIFNKNLVGSPMLHVKCLPTSGMRNGQDPISLTSVGINSIIYVGKIP
uniref:Uncharacterized protein n=1 Tax=Lactuca sativa TaxID=4236 RepID=A0A9R1UGV9_LACSA|nr:hypothetical protein LSAT_V11C900459790 [Lactuca sativa]